MPRRADGRGASQPILPDITQAKPAEAGLSALPCVNAQMEVALLALCCDEAMTVVRNVAKGQGLDVWRRWSTSLTTRLPISVD